MKSIFGLGTARLVGIRKGIVKLNNEIIREYQGSDSIILGTHDHPAPSTVDVDDIPEGAKVKYTEKLLRILRNGKVIKWKTETTCEVL